MSMTNLDRPTKSTLNSLAGASVEEAVSLTGEVIGGILEVGELLGKGGMGVVYEVFHREWNRKLAMKLPIALGDQDDFDLKRWVREAHTWIDLGLHPRVVSCWFVRQWNGVPILFLDLFAGGSLKERMERRAGPPSNPDEWGECLTWLIHACEGLEHAHQMGLVHRDMKPANLLFNSEGMLAVTDFGLGKAINKAESIKGSPLALLQQSAEMSHLESSLTKTGVMSGTPHYAPPEQWMQKKVGPQADIYAFAVMAYEVLTGRHPYEPPGERWSLGQLISAHLMGQPPPAQSFHAEVPTPLSEALVHCLAKKDTDRPHNMREIREVLVNAFKERTGRDYNFGYPQPLSQRADSLNNKAVSLWSIGLREEAMQAWGEADRLERNHLEVTYNRMVTSWLTGRKTAVEAEKVIRDLSSVSVRGRSLAGMFMLTRGKFPESVSLLEESLDNTLLSEDGTIWRGLGEACLAIGDHERARFAFERVLALIPTDAASKNCLRLIQRGDVPHYEGLVSHTSWKARGRLLGWVITDDGEAVISLFGRHLVVTDLEGKERVSLEVPLSSSAPSLQTKGKSILLIDGQSAWSMTLSKGEEWKLTELRQWQQRVLGFVGDKAILTGDTTLQLRSAADQSSLGPLLMGHEKQVLCYTTTADGKKLFTGGADRVIRVWNVSDGQCQMEGRGHSDFVSAIALGSQEQLFVSGDRAGQVILWLLPKMEKLHRFEFSGWISRVTLQGEGRGQVLFVQHHPDEAETRTAVIFLDRLQVVFDRPGHFFPWAPGFGIWEDDGFSLFGLPEGVEWRTQEVPGGPVMNALFNSEGSEVLLWTDVGDYNRYRLPEDVPESPSLPLVRANTLSEVQQARQQFANLMEAAWSSYRAENWSEAYWQLSKARLVEGYAREPETLEFLTRLAKRLKRRELREMWRIRELQAPGHDRTQQLAIDYKGNWAATSSSHVIRLWDLKNGTCIRGLTGHRDEVVYLEFWEGGLGFGAAPLLLSFSADRTVRLWNPNSGDCLQSLQIAEHPIVAVGVSQTSRRFACVTRGGQLLVGGWKGEEPFEFELQASIEYQGVPHQVNFAEDGDMIIVGEEKSRFYKLKERDGTLTISASGDTSHSIGMPLPRFEQLAGLNQKGDLELVGLKKKKPVAQLASEIKKIQSVTCSGDGGVLATLDDRDNLCLWLVDARLCVLERPVGFRLKRILFSGNGRYLAGLAESGSLVLWEMEWQLDPTQQKVAGPAAVASTPASPAEAGKAGGLSWWAKLKKLFGF